MPNTVKTCSLTTVQPYNRKGVVSIILYVWDGQQRKSHTVHDLCSPHSYAVQSTKDTCLSSDRWIWQMTVFVCWGQYTCSLHYLIQWWGGQAKLLSLNSIIPLIRNDVIRKTKDPSQAGKLNKVTPVGHPGCLPVKPKSSHTGLKKMFHSSPGA